jgi:hypothetical protein
VRRVVGIEGETVRIVLPQPGVYRLGLLNRGGIRIQQDVDRNHVHGASPFLVVHGECLSG